MKQCGATETTIEVVLQPEGNVERAQSLAAHLGLPLRIEEPLGSKAQSKREPNKATRNNTRRDEKLSSTKETALQLRFSSRGLALAQENMELALDFNDMQKRIQPSKLQRELLVRAAKIKRAATCEHPLTAIDTTAGLGQDSFLLAAAGFNVVMFERDPIIAALLGDALARACSSANETTAAIANRMTLLEGDSITELNAFASLNTPASRDTSALPNSSPSFDAASLPQSSFSVDPSTLLKNRPDVVYLDPMFPERSKSAAVKKKFQLLHHLEKPCQDAEALLEAALKMHPHKIIIKRPAKGPYLANTNPSYSLKGKTIRYDCIVLP